MEHETGSYDHRLSEVLSDILKCCGFFVERNNILRSKCLLSEKIVKYLYGYIYIHCGSRMAEGSGIFGSDQDIMKVLPRTLAIDGDCNVVDKTIDIFTIVLDNCLPGYTRLRVHRLNQGYNGLLSMSKKDGNSKFLSSKEFLKLILDGSCENLPFPLRIFHFQGPCKTVELWNTYGDVTIGLECNSWPVAAMKWINRPRRKGWPSQCIIDKIASLPVHVVPVGDPTSNFSSTQWRFSFNFAERELFWSFNDIQVQCYVLLKVIFKGKLKHFSADRLSGYQMKNLMFWISEEYGVTIFTKKNLLRCLELCLKTYSDQIYNSLLPHYILLDRNLLAKKLEFKTRKLITGEISKILDNIFCAIVECRHLIPGANKYLSLYEGSKRHFICQVMTPLFYELEKQPMKLKFVLYKQFSIVMTTISYPFFFLNYTKILDLIYDMRTRNEFRDNVVPYMLETAKALYFIQVGMLICQNMNGDENKLFMKAVVVAFEMGTDFDELSGKLYLVTFALLNNDIDKAWSILLRVLNQTKPFICGNGNFICGNGSCTLSLSSKHVLQFSNKNVYYIEPASVRYEDLSYCYEIVFPTYIVNFVQEPIQYELFLQKCTNQTLFCCGYHPVVYAFYLWFEITRKKYGKNDASNEILSKLFTFIEQGNSRFDHYRSYNLLGFCYYKCGQFNKALAAYCRSIWEKI